jgi:hypothetical protein
MTMGNSLSHPAPATHEITDQDRMERLAELTPAQRGDALLWLSGYAPDVFDAVLDAVEPFPDDGTDDPAPYCDRCGADIGVLTGGTTVAPTARSSFSTRATPRT